jgi:hypothetical protein
MIYYNIFSRYSSSREAAFFWRPHASPSCFELLALSFQLEAFLDLAKTAMARSAKATALVPLFLVLLFPCVARADVSVSIKLDRKEATLPDSVQMVVSVSGSRSSDLQPMVRGLEAFNVTQGGTASRLEIINGKVNAGVDYTYFIQPKKAGKFQIGPAEVTVEGKTFSSNTATITIIKQPQASGVDRGPLLLNAGLSPTRAYVEEQPIYTVKLYRQMKVSDISLDLPDTEHLVFKQLGKPLEYQSVLDGKTYQVLEVRYALIPSEAGLYTIGPTRMTMTVYPPRRRTSRGLFNDPFFGDPFFSFSTTGRPMTLASEPQALTVLPLPETGRPADFSGLVGRFDIESKLEPATIKAGESATLTVLLSGRGNVNRIPDLKGPELSHTKVYADEPVLKVETDAEGLAGSKTMKWALVPERQGRYEIPPLSVSFFDTTTHQYRVIKTRPISLSVLPGEPEAVQASSQRADEHASEGSGKKAVEELGRDILPVHTSAKDLAAGYRIRPGHVLFWLVLMVPPFLCGATFWGRRFREKSDQSIAATKAKKAAKKLIQKCRQGGMSSSELALCIRDFLNERFDMALGSLTPDEGAEILRSKGVSLETAYRLRSVLQRLEDAVYTGKGHECRDIPEDVPKLIKQIQKEIR